MKKTNFQFAPDGVLPLDAQNNEALWIGRNIILVDYVLRQCPEVVVTWQDGLLRVGDCTIGTRGVSLTSDNFTLLLEAILTSHYEARRQAPPDPKIISAAAIEVNKDALRALAEA